MAGAVLPARATKQQRIQHPHDGVGGVGDTVFGSARQRDENGSDYLEQLHSGTTDDWWCRGGSEPSAYVILTDETGAQIKWPHREYKAGGWGGEVGPPSVTSLALTDGFIEREHTRTSTSSLLP